MLFAVKAGDASLNLKVLVFSFDENSSVMVATVEKPFKSNDLSISKPTTFISAFAFQLIATFAAVKTVPSINFKVSIAVFAEPVWAFAVVIEKAAIKMQIVAFELSVIFMT